MSKSISFTSNAPKRFEPILLVNLWLSAVLLTFLLLRVLESRATSHFFHALSLR
jgi:hypothetical protein